VSLILPHQRPVCSLVRSPPRSPLFLLCHSCGQTPSRLPCPHVQVVEHRPASEFLSKPSEPPPRRRSTAVPLSCCHRHPLFGESSLRRILSSFTCRGALLTPPSMQDRLEPCSTTTSLLSHRNAVAAVGEPPRMLPPLLMWAGAQKHAELVHREPWALAVSLCSLTGSA
jgi:hypothetical protein